MTGAIQSTSLPCVLDGLVTKTVLSSDDLTEEVKIRRIVTAPQPKPQNANTCLDVGPTKSNNTIPLIIEQTMIRPKLLKTSPTRSVKKVLSPPAKTMPRSAYSVARPGYSKSAGPPKSPRRPERKRTNASRAFNATHYVPALPEPSEQKIGQPRVSHYVPGIRSAFHHPSKQQCVQPTLPQPLPNPQPETAKPASTPLPHPTIPKPSQVTQASPEEQKIEKSAKMSDVSEPGPSTNNVGNNPDSVQNADPDTYSTTASSSQVQHADKRDECADSGDTLALSTSTQSNIEPNVESSQKEPSTMEPVTQGQAGMSHMTPQHAVTEEKQTHEAPVDHCQLATQQHSISVSPTVSGNLKRKCKTEVVYNMAQPTIYETILRFILGLLIDCDFHLHFGCQVFGSLEMRFYSQ